MAESKENRLPLNPLIPAGSEAARVLIDAVKRLANVHERSEVASIRANAFQASNRCAEFRQALRVCVSVMCDLRIQGWDFGVEGSQVWSSLPIANSASPLLEKQRVREAHLFERDSQLSLPATREFIRNMERRRLKGTRWVSVLSLIRDGPELSAKLREAIFAGGGTATEDLLRKCIDPYVQIVDRDSSCEFTGLKLTEIWRYFRHTWAIPYYSVPGRQVWILIRDRAAENHPVIGIAALGSAVVQLTPRDQWIGWTPREFIKYLEQHPTSQWAKWLKASLQQLNKAIYVTDFIKEKVIARSDLRSPSPCVIEKLLETAKDARHWHTKYPKKDLHKKNSQDWKAEAQSYLFRAKRSKVLAELLGAKLKLKEAGFKSTTKGNLIAALKTSPGRRAVEFVLRQMKGVHVGIDMLDITVCGAIPPYNPLLGGKLVAMLLTSPEVALAYEKKYSNSESIIASSMAARPIIRKPNLVFLGTTSLYGVSSSQYNRLKMPSLTAGGKAGESISYVMLGRSLGYGSNHLSATTVNEIEIFLAQSKDGRRVNSIFGEGVNPRLRKIRDGLALVGLPSDALLMHGNPRIVYGVALAKNFRNVLMGRARRPRYIIPRSDPNNATLGIANFWMRRWLTNRIQREDVLKEVEAHSLNYPLHHGARVVLPPLEEEAPLFAVSR
ncbi:MAG: Druantia anti-phage system protein DruA [Terriglobia bacterium]